MIEKVSAVGFLSAAATLLVSAYLVLSWWRNKPKIFLRVGTVKKLIIYPIKSLAGIEVPQIQVTKTGLRYGKFSDRQWMLIDSKSNELITQRVEPTLVLVQPSFHSDENEIWIDAQDQPTLKIKVKENLGPNDSIISSEIWKAPVQGVDCGPEAAEWFNNYLGRGPGAGVKLIQHLPAKLPARPSNHVTNNLNVKDEKFPILYQDDTGLHIINEKSVEDLNERLPPEAARVSHRNFRPSILVEGFGPYDEDFWTKNIRLGCDAEFVCLKPCERCVLTTVNPDTGVKDNIEPLKTLRTYRAARNPREKKLYGYSPLFGMMYGPVDRPAGGGGTNPVIRVGDDVWAED